MVHVPYGGSAPALQDIMGDRVDLLFDNLASSLPLYRAQKLQIIAVGSLQRIAALPDVPTVAEIGVPGFESGTWFAIVAPPTPPANDSVGVSSSGRQVFRRTKLVLLGFVTQQRFVNADL